MTESTALRNAVINKRQDTAKVICETNPVARAEFEKLNPGLVTALAELLGEPELEP